RSLNVGSMSASAIRYTIRLGPFESAGWPLLGSPLCHCANRRNTLAQRFSLTAQALNPAACQILPLMTLPPHVPVWHNKKGQTAALNRGVANSPTHQPGDLNRRCIRLESGEGILIITIPSYTHQ